MGSQCCKCQSGKKAKGTRAEQELVGDRYRVAENNNLVHLTMHHVNCDDAGVYTLIAKNAAGETRAGVELQVDGGGPLDAPKFLRSLNDLAVKVGTRTRFLVEIRSSTSLKVSWYRNEKRVEDGDRFHLLHEGNFFCVDVAPVTVEEQGRWTCVAENLSGKSNCSSYLNVLVPKAYKAPEFLEELRAILTEQGTVSLECKVIGVPTPILKWYKEGREIKAGDVFALTANVDDPTSLGTYTCEALNCMGKAVSSSKVHVVGKGSREGSLKPADSLQPSGPAPVFGEELRNEKLKIGDKLMLSCQVTVPPWPKAITWYNKQGRVESSEKYHIMEDGKGGYTVEIHPSEAVDEGEWKCVATSSDGAKSITKCQVSMTIPKNYRKPRFLESLKAILTEEGLVSFECKVVGFPTPVLRWFKDGQELKPGDVYQLTGTNSLGSYSCIAHNCMGEATSTAELTVEDIQNQLNEEERLQLFSSDQPPKFVHGLKSGEAKINDPFRFTVQVSISPEPSISWYRDDEQIEDSDRYRLCKEPLGTYHLDIIPVEIVDQAEWKCIATNDFGHSVTSCFLKLTIPRHFKKPRFLECLRAILSEEGAVNLECKVIGVPQPVLKWYKDGAELKPGDIHRIISGQDGTCCLGTYTCEAHNCMGTVSSSASLLGFEERMVVKGAPEQKPVLDHVRIARNPSLSTIHEERTSQMVSTYDTPATDKSLTVDERAEVSFSFDGKEVSVSLYETPDLTEEEALQIVEMYAEELSEHVSEHNVVELPALRFVKETSTSGNLLMEAVLIDVSAEGFETARTGLDDDLRTEADLEDLSITDDVQTPPEVPYDNVDDFYEKTIPKTVQYSLQEPVKVLEPDVLSGRLEELSDRQPLSKIQEKADEKAASIYEAIQIEEREVGSEEGRLRSSEDSFYSLSTKAKEAEVSAKGVAVREERVLQLHEASSLSQEEASKAKAKEVEASRVMGVADVDEPSIYTDAVGQLSDQDTLSKIETFASARESTSGMRVAEAEEQNILSQGLQAMSEQPSAGKLKESAKMKQVPAYQVAAIVEQQDVLSAGLSLSEDESLKRLEQEAQAKLSLRQGVVLQQQQALEGTAEPLSDRTSMADLGTLASSTEESERALGVIEHQEIMEGTVESMRVKAGQELTQAKSLTETAKGIAVVQQQHLLEESPDVLSERTRVSELATLAASMQESHMAFAMKQEQGVLEDVGESIQEKTSVSQLATLARPVQELQTAVQGVQQTTLEGNIESLSDRTGISSVATLAKTGQEAQKGFAVVQQQELLEGSVQSISEATTIGNLLTSAKSLEEQQRGLATVQQQELLENQLRTMSDKTNLEELATVARVGQEKQRGIAISEEQQVLSEAGTLSASKSESSTVGVVKQVSPLVAAAVSKQEALQGEAETLSDVESMSKLEEIASESEATLHHAATIEMHQALQAEPDSLSLTKSLTTEGSLKDITPQEALLLEEQKSLEDAATMSNVESLSKLRQTAAVKSEMAKEAVASQEQVAVERAVSLSEASSVTKATGKQTTLESSLKEATAVKQQVMEAQKVSVEGARTTEEASERSLLEGKQEMEIMQKITDIAKKLTDSAKEALKVISGPETDTVEIIEEDEKIVSSRQSQEEDRQETEKLAKVKAEADRKKSKEEKTVTKQKTTEKEGGEQKLALEENLRKEKAEAERKEEQDRTMKETEEKRKHEQEKVKEENADSKDRTAQEKTKKQDDKAKKELEGKMKQKEEKLKKEKTETDSKKKEEDGKKEEQEEEQLIKEKTELERRNKEEEERKKKTDVERNKTEAKEKKQQEEDKLKKEEAEAERRKMEEEERKKKEEDERMKKETEAKKKQEEEKLNKKKAEAEHRKKEEVEKKRKQEEEKLKKEKAESERKKKEEEELKNEENERKKKESEEKEKQEEEKLKKQKAEMERKKKEEEEKKKQQEEDKLKKEKTEAERKKKEEDEKKKIEEEKLKKEKAKAERKKKEEEEKRRKEEDERKKKEAEEKKQEEEKLKKQKAEAESKKKEDDEKKKIEEEKLKKEKAEAERKKKEEEEKKRKEEDERKKKEAEEKKKEEEKLKKEKTEAERKKKEDEEKKKKEEDERKKKEAEEKKKQEEEKLKEEKAEAENRKKEDDKKKKKEEERMKKEAEEKKKQEEELKKEKAEAERKKKEDDEKKKKEDDEKKKENERMKREAEEKKKQEEEKLKKEKAEAERKKMEDDEKKKKEEVERKKKEADEKKKLEEEKLKKEKAEAERKKKEEDEKKKIEEEKLKKEKAEAEHKKKEEEEKRRKEEDERKKKEAEEKKQEEEKLKKQKAEAERKKKEDDEKKKMEEEEKLRKEKAKVESKKKEEDERKKKEETKKKEAEEKKKQEEEIVKKEKAEAERKKKEEDEKKKMEEEEKLRKEKAEVESKKKEEDERKKKEETKKKEAEEKKKQEEEKVKKEKAEAERKKKEEDEKKKKEDDERKKKEAEEKKKQEEEKLKKEMAETERKKKEEDEKKKKEEDERRKKEVEAERKKKEDGEKKKMEEEEKLKKEKAVVESKKKEEDESKKKEETKKKEAEEKKKQEEEIVKKEKAEAERKKKEEDEKKKMEEEEKLKKEKAKVESKKKEEDERKKKEETKKKEAEEKKKQEEEKVKKEKTEAERKKKEEDEKKTEETKKKQEDEKLKKEKAEAERKKKEEEEKNQETKKKETEEKKKQEEEKVKKEKAEAQLKKKEEEKKKDDEGKRKEADEKKKLEEEKVKREKADTERKKEKIEDKKMDDESEKKISEKKKQEEEKPKRGKAETECKKDQDDTDRRRKEEVDAEEKLRKEKAELKTKLGEERKRRMSGEKRRPSEEKDTKAMSEKKLEAREGRREDESQQKLSDSQKSEKKDAEGRKLRREEEEDGRKGRAETERRRRRSTDSETTSTYSASVTTTSTLDEVRRAKVRSRDHGDDSLSGMEDIPRDAVSIRPSRSRQATASEVDDISTDASSASRAKGSASRGTRVRDAAAQEINEPARRDYRKKPKFCTRLTDRTAAQGSNIKLTCSILGSPEPQVEWLKNGFPLPYDVNKYHTRYENGLASLEVLAASSTDTAEYTCVVKNVHGENSSSADLRVYAGFEPAPFPPTFTKTIQDCYQYADDELTLECRVRGQPQPKITWLKDGTLVRPSSRFQQRQLPDGICRLVISCPEPSDSGNYTCRAENQVWTDQISTTVEFKGREGHEEKRADRSICRGVRDTRPQFSSKLTDHLVPVGGTIALQVEVAGTPRPDVMWMREAEVLPPSPKIRTFEEGNLHTLTVINATPSEAGSYTCRASNLFGISDTSARIQVVSGRGWTERPAMFVDRPDHTLSVAVGEDIVVSFRVTGEPKPKVTWMKGTRDITNSQRSMKETVNDYVRLTFKRALVSDSGTYCILAKNIYGCDRAFVTVRVRQRARSLTPSPEWDKNMTANLLRDIHQDQRFERTHKDVPGPIGGEPVATDSGRNWVALTWPKPDHRGAATVMAYRVEAWLVGEGAQWTELGVTPINSYDAFNLKSEREYLFRVTPRNRYGWGEPVATSVPVVVGRKVELPEFIRILPGQLKALRGMTIKLECQVRGDPVPEVVWHRDGTPIDIAQYPRFSKTFDGSRCCIVIEDLQDSDEGRYMCEATNKVGRVSTFARLLIVSDPKIWEADRNLKRGILEDGPLTDSPPQFTMRLRDRRVQFTYPVRLTCQVIGYPTPEVTWKKDGEDLEQDDRHTFWSDENFHTLEISNTLCEDSGSYAITAKNAHGSVSCKSHLVVDKGIRAYVAPEFLYGMDDCAVKENGEIRLIARVEAYPTVGVMWHRDGVKLRPSRRTIMTLDNEGTVQLIVVGASPKDSGIYCCTATNEVGRSDISSKVTVTPASSTTAPRLIGPDKPYSKAPMFVTKPRSSEAIEGDTVIILCEVVGDPKPDVIWLRDWLKPDYYRDAPHFRRIGEGPEYRLEIPCAKLDYTGAYSVIARNCHGEAKAVISLQIYAKGQGKEEEMMNHRPVKHGKVQTLPVFAHPLKDLRCCDGDAVTLECKVQATPPPEIRWEKGGRLVHLGGDFHADFDGEVARLSIREVYPEDEGEYSCVAYNDLGRAATSACLIVDVPEEKENLLSRQLCRPPGLLSAGSTPRSTPRSTPSRSKSPSLTRDMGYYRSEHAQGRREQEITKALKPIRLKLAPPKFYAVPHNKVAEEGDTVRFQCAIAGHPTPWVTWDKDGLLLTPTTRIKISEKDDIRIVEISEVTVEDAGLYRVTIENEVGRVEASARLDVIGRGGQRARGVRAWSASPRSSPAFSRRLVGTTVRVGARATLACDIRGSPAPGTKWYRDGELIVRSSRVIPTWNGRTARLEIVEVEPEDAGVYTCVALNDAGRCSCSAKLEVLDTDDPNRSDREPPEYVDGLKDIVARDGQSMEMQVRLKGTPPFEIVWVRNNQEIPDCDDFRYVDYGDGRFGLRIRDVFPEDADVYFCEAYNEYGDATTWGRLQVKECSSEPPRITKKPTSVLVTSGQSAMFCVRVAGTPRPHVRWTVAGQPVQPTSSRFQLEEDGDVHILHITKAEPGDGGAVVCTASNDEGSTSCSSELTVLTPTAMNGNHEGVLEEQPVRPGPEVWRSLNGDVSKDSPSPATILRGPHDVTVLRGDIVTLRAHYTGTPPPIVQWMKAGKEVITDERITIQTDERMSSLTIRDITADDSGKYVVNIDNPFGADCHFASVAVEGVPDPPAGQPTVTPTEGESNAATVAWSSAPYDGGCIVTGYSIEMRRVGTDSGNWQVVATRCHSLSQTVRGLSPDDQYVFRVRAENVHGLSEPSSESIPFQPGQSITSTDSFDEEVDFGSPFEPKHVSVEPGDVFKEQYDIHEELGKGRYGIVYKVTDRRCDQKFAAKIIKCIKSKDKEKVYEEIEIMNCLRHSKLLQLAAAFESQREIVMVMEYISGGELFERVVADDFTLTERDCILFMRQICEGVEYMHQNNIVHLDLKPENILCRTRTSHQIKVIDFGLARKLVPDVPVRVLFGTPEFIPPEIINYEPIGFSSDMWSVGVICYVLLSGLSPFMGDSDAETFSNITRADYDFDDEAFDAITQDAKDFISSLLKKRKEKRLTATECLGHKWLTTQENANYVKLSTDKLKKFIIRRKWQKTGNAIRALGRMATLSARRNSTSSASSSPRASLSSVSRMSSLTEDQRDSLLSDQSFDYCCNKDLESPPTYAPFGMYPNNGQTDSLDHYDGQQPRVRMFSERSDSGISDCSVTASVCSNQLLTKEFSISELDEENQCEPVTNNHDRKTLARNAWKTPSKTNSTNTSKDTDVPPSSVVAKTRKSGSLTSQSSSDSGVHADVMQPKGRNQNFPRGRLFKDSSRGKTSLDKQTHHDKKVALSNNVENHKSATVWKR